MPAPRQVTLTPGVVYRTAHLARWGANPTRLARRLEGEGRLQRVFQGLFYAPVQSRFGAVPPSDEALLTAFFDGSPWLLTGPPRWNALGLGSTQLFARPLVYNTKRTGTVKLGRKTFELRRVAFPTEPSAEWFAIDLLRNAERVGLAADELEESLRAAVSDGRLSKAGLTEMAASFGRRTERDLVRRAVA